MSVATSAADAIVASLRDAPHEWTVSNYTLTHRTGLELWHADGIFFVYLYTIPGSNDNVKFSVVEKFRIYHAMRQIIARYVASRQHTLNRKVVDLLKSERPA